MPYSAGATKTIEQKRMIEVIGLVKANLNIVLRVYKFILLHLIGVVREEFNPDFKSLITPLNVTRYYELLLQSEYDESKTRYLVDGFTNGFDLGYRGPKQVRREARNLRLRVGSKTELWNKIMEEVQQGRFAGGFRNPPFEFFIQSPLGLVPKGQDKTRMIFHLSFPEKESVNYYTPKDMCKTKYNEFDVAVRLCAKAGLGAHMAKSDLKSGRSCQFA